VRPRIYKDDPDPNPDAFDGHLAALDSQEAPPASRSPRVGAVQEAKALFAVFANKTMTQELKAGHASSRSNRWFPPFPKKKGKSFAQFCRRTSFSGPLIVSADSKQNSATFSATRVL